MTVTPSTEKEDEGRRPCCQAPPLAPGLFAYVKPGSFGRGGTGPGEGVGAGSEVAEVAGGGPRERVEVTGRTAGNREGGGPGKEPGS